MQLYSTHFLRLFTDWFSVAALLWVVVECLVVTEVVGSEADSMWIHKHNLRQSYTQSPMLGITFSNKVSSSEILKYIFKLQRTKCEQAYSLIVHLTPYADLLHISSLTIMSSIASLIIYILITSILHRPTSSN